MFTFTEDGIVIILGLIINFPRNSLAQELAALAINLSHNHRNAERMAQDGNLSHLMIRLQETKDPLLMKIIRNISNWTFNIQAASPDSTNEYRYRGLWSPHVKSMMQLAKVSDNSDLLVELLGTLGAWIVVHIPTSGASVHGIFQQISLQWTCPHETGSPYSKNASLHHTCVVGLSRGFPKTIWYWKCSCLWHKSQMTNLLRCSWRRPRWLHLPNKLGEIKPTTQKLSFNHCTCSTYSFRYQCNL